MKLTGPRAPGPSALRSTGDPVSVRVTTLNARPSRRRRHPAGTAARRRPADGARRSSGATSRKVSEGTPLRTSVVLTGFSESAYRTALRQPRPRPCTAWPVAAAVMVNSHQRSSGASPCQLRTAAGTSVGSASSTAQASSVSSLPRSRASGLPPVFQRPAGIPSFLSRRLNSTRTSSAIAFHLARGSTTRSLAATGPNPRDGGASPVSGSKRRCSATATSSRLPAGTVTTKWCSDSAGRKPNPIDAVRASALAAAFTAPPRRAPRARGCRRSSRGTAGPRRTGRTAPRPRPRQPAAAL